MSEMENSMSLDEKRMLKLVEYTRENSPNEPYGCSIYDDEDNLLVSATGNKQSPINHAEIIAINTCAENYPEISWSHLTLYTTGEPCCMCTSACCWANLGKIVYATDIPFMIELWNIESSHRAEDIILSHPKKPILTGGVARESANQLFAERKELFAEACRLDAGFSYYLANFVTLYSLYNALQIQPKSTNLKRRLDLEIGQTYSINFT